MTKTKFEAMEILNKYDIPCGPILSMKELAEEPSLRETGTVVEVDHPKRGKYLTVGNPIKLQRQPDRGQALAAAGRAHRRDPAQVLGFDDETVQDRGDQARSSGTKPMAADWSNRKMTGESSMAHECDGERKAAVRKILAKAKAEGRSALTAPEGKLVCDAYGIAVPKEGRRQACRRGGRSSRAQDGLPGRAEDRLARHPAQDRGGRRRRRRQDRRRRREKAYATIVANAKKYDRKAKIDGVQVQQMLGGGHEVIVGAVTDPSFGKLVAFGLGGVLVEVLKDVTFRLAPATREDALSHARRHQGRARC